MKVNQQLRDHLHKVIDKAFQDGEIDSYVLTMVSFYPDRCQIKHHGRGPATAGALLEAQLNAAISCCRKLLGYDSLLASKLLPWLLACKQKLRELDEAEYCGHA